MYQEGVCAEEKIDDLRFYTFILAEIEMYLFDYKIRPAI
jgi:hypothetical protein